jgi:3-hydroxy-9,10-secoandrosta-1,3,5(10)-triene-9,17-dione monooxygenase reductase component
MTVDAQAFRATMSTWASGVAVVTSRDGAAPVGLTVSAFTSLSLSPPLILVCIDCRSNTLAAILRAQIFAVNILAEDQAALSSCFAVKHTLDKFAAVGWQTAVTGAPLLDGAVAWLDCELFALHDGGDHLILVGRVLATETRVDQAPGPLLYYRGAYQQLEPAAAIA